VPAGCSCPVTGNKIDNIYTAVPGVPGVLNINNLCAKYNVSNIVLKIKFANYTMLQGGQQITMLHKREDLLCVIFLPVFFKLLVQLYGVDITIWDCLLCTVARLWSG
jgi:hypothetical protein